MYTSFTALTLRVYRARSFSSTGTLAARSAAWRQEAGGNQRRPGIHVGGMHLASLVDGHDEFYADVEFEKYDMVQLPDSMVDTTMWVGNLNEFTKDGQLSDLFQQCCSGLLSVPCVVARRPNTDSLGYGFVTFPTEREAEVRARLHNHGSSAHFSCCD